jgi:hypothetical protein
MDKALFLNKKYDSLYMDIAKGKEMNGWIPVAY